jgi:Ni,Fe-hydrogenase III large subunit
MSDGAVSPAEYRARLAEALADGARFGSLYASTDGAQGVIRTVLCLPGGALRCESVAVSDGRAPSIVDLTPAAEWAEREAHDLHGVAFDGHEPLRPLAEHTPELASWTVPVAGSDAYQVAVGPIHAGVIESGHFRFHVVGDRILYLDVRLFYKHRGLERAAVHVPLDDAIAYAARACGACAVTNRVAYAHAVERLRGLRPTAAVARARTLLLELERLWNHLNDIAAICAGVGLAAGNQRFAALCEDARRLNAALTGHRLLFDSVHVGGSRLAIDDGRRATALEALTGLRGATTAMWRELVFNTSFQDRLVDIGVLGRDDAIAWGAVGPAARAAGVAEDARAVGDDWLAYDDFRPALGEHAAGDVRARLEQRELELQQTFALLARLLEQPVAPGACAPDSEPLEHAVTRVESPRGATICALERSGDAVGRLHLRTGSYANWPVLARVAPGNLLPDFPLINKSFELCYACADR